MEHSRNVPALYEEGVTSRSRPARLEFSMHALFIIQHCQDLRLVSTGQSAAAVQLLESAAVQAAHIWSGGSRQLADIQQAAQGRQSG
jgi:hypothetical protein